MNPTVNQLARGMRGKKRRRSIFAFFKGGPHRRALIIRTPIMSPRKPNSARRTYAKVRIIVTRKVAFAKIPGIGEHGLLRHAVVLMEGKGAKDCPGINFTLVRGLLDFNGMELFGRRQKRSKFGVKKYK